MGRRPYFSPPASSADALDTCAGTLLDFGDGAMTDPRPRVRANCRTVVTWREQRQIALGAHGYTGPGPYAAASLGRCAAEALVEPAGDYPAAAAVRASERDHLPTVSLFQITPVSGQPMQRLVKLRVEGLTAGQRLRLDGGAAQVHWLSDAEGGTQAAEFGLTYAKPGPYTVALDLLDADGFYVAALAETPLEIGVPDELAAAPLCRPLTPSFLKRSRLQPPTATSAGPQPWLPYRYIKPTRYGVYTYAGPGGAARRSVNPGIYLSVRAETTAGSERWYQTAQGDWIAASIVTFFQPSELRGVVLDGRCRPRRHLHPHRRAPRNRHRDDVERARQARRQRRQPAGCHAALGRRSDHLRGNDGGRRGLVSDRRRALGSQRVRADHQHARAARARATV